MSLRDLERLWSRIANFVYAICTPLPGGTNSTKFCHSVWNAKNRTRKSVVRGRANIPAPVCTWSKSEHMRRRSYHIKTISTFSRPSSLTWPKCSGRQRHREGTFWSLPKVNRANFGGVVAKKWTEPRNYAVQSWTWVESIHGSGWVGLGHKIIHLVWVGLGWVQCQIGLGPVSKLSNKYTIYTQETVPQL